MILFFIFFWALFSGHPFIAMWLIVHAALEGDL